MQQFKSSECFPISCDYYSRLYVLKLPMNSSSNVTFSPCKSKMEGEIVVQDPPGERVITNKRGGGGGGLEYVLIS